MNILNKKIYIVSVAILFCSTFFLAAKSVSAAELRLESNNKNVSVGDTTSIDVIINTEGENINVIDGSINIPSGLNLVEIKELSIANSALSQWVRTPSLSIKDGNISFIGGLPGGLNKKSASLFRIFFTSKLSGQVTFSPNDIKVYANDGLATQVGVHVTPISITINENSNLPVKDELKAVTVKDFKAPTNINVDLGQDESLFDGQKFINISASDSESGIDYFEVKEGNRESVRTSNSYVLQNQNNLEPIAIFAFDKAGNVSKKILSTYSPKNSYLWITVIILSVAMIASLFILYRIFKKKKKTK